MMPVHNSTFDQCRFLSVEQVIAQSGLSASTVRRWIKRGVLPHAQPGGKRSRVLIPADALDRLSHAEVVSPTPTVQPLIEVQPPAPQRRGPTPRWQRSFASN